MFPHQAGKLTKWALLLVFAATITAVLTRRLAAGYFIVLGGVLLAALDVILRTTPARAWRRKHRREPARTTAPAVVRPEDVPAVKGVRWGRWEEAAYRQEQARAQQKKQELAEREAATAVPWFLNAPGQGLLAALDGLARLRYPGRLERGVLVFACGASMPIGRGLVAVVTWSSLDGQWITLRTPQRTRTVDGEGPMPYSLRALDCCPCGDDIGLWLVPRRRPAAG